MLKKQGNIHTLYVRQQRALKIPFLSSEIATRYDLFILCD